MSNVEASPSVLGSQFSSSNEEYLVLLSDAMENGARKKSRGKLSDGTQPDTFSVFGRQMVFDLRQGLPIVTTKKMHLNSIIHELLWFLRGDTNIKYLKDNGVRIWDEWANPETGDCGPIYGKQWRRWEGPNGEVDQLAEVIKLLRTNPDSRRIMVSAWNPPDVPKMALPPCHALWQCYVANGELSLQLYQRSADVFLGVPFNIASYAILTHMLAHVTGLKARAFIHTFGDLHLYENHKAQAMEQLQRTPFAKPTLWLDPSVTEIDQFRREHIDVRGYQCHPALKAEVAV